MEAEEKRKRKIPELFAESTAFKITAVVLACLLAVGITVGGYLVLTNVASAKKRVPNFADLDESHAREKAEAAGLGVRFEYEDETHTGDEVVTEQSFSPGAKVGSGTTIILTMKDEDTEPSSTPGSTSPDLSSRLRGLSNLSARYSDRKTAPSFPQYYTPAQRAAMQGGQQWAVTCTPSSIAPGQACTLRSNFLHVVPKNGDELWFLIRTPGGKKYCIIMDTLGNEFKRSYTTTYPLPANMNTTGRNLGISTETGLYQVFFVDTGPRDSNTGLYPLTNYGGCGEFTVSAAVAPAPAPAPAPPPATSPAPSPEPPNLEAPPAMLNFGCWEAENLSYYLSKGSIYPKPTHVPRCGAYEYADANHIRYVLFMDAEEDGWDPNNPATYPWKTTEIRVIDDTHVQLLNAGLMNWNNPLTFHRIN